MSIIKLNTIRKPLRLLGVAICCVIVPLVCFWLNTRMPESGVIATYYGNSEWRGEPALVQPERDINLTSYEKAFAQGRLPAENFSIAWNGWLRLEQEGNYKMATISDDGSSVIIDDQLIVNNGGLHGNQRVKAQIRLSQGMHKINVNYFNGPGSYAFALHLVIDSDGPNQPLSANVFYPHRLSEFEERLIRHAKHLPRIAAGAIIVGLCLALNMHSVIGGRSKRLILVTGMTILLTTYLFYQFDQPQTGIDDADIFFVYARHLAAGHGFVYNIGGERVEGFSSLLWVLIVAGVFVFTDRPEFILLILNVLLLSLATWHVIEWLLSWPQSHQSRWRQMLPVLYFAIVYSVPDYLIWMTLPHMDIGLWSCLLTLTGIRCLTFDRDLQRHGNVTFSVLLILLILTRPEAIAWGLIFIFFTGVQVAYLYGFERLWKTLWLPCCSYCGTIGLLTWFRMAYFGYPFPNTYYAKVSPSFGYNIRTGLDYLRSYVNAGLVFEIILVGAIVGVVLNGAWFLRGFSLRQALSEKNTSARSGRKEALAGLILSSFAGLGLLLPVLTGGDHFKSFRFYQPLFPFFIINVLFLCKRCVRLKIPRQYFGKFSANRSVVVVTWGLIVITGGIVIWLTHHVNWQTIRTNSIWFEFEIARNGRRNGESLGRLFAALPTYPSVGVIAAGGIKYTYPGIVIDLMGLNNLTMGHSPGERKGLKNHAAFNKDVFYQLTPDIIIDVGMLQGIEEEAAFNTLYDYVEIEREFDSFEGFIAKDFWATLANQEAYRIETRSRATNID